MIVDFHTHILPNIDDGSSSLIESIEMLQEEARQGITHVVVTPHFYPNQERPERFLEKRSEAVKRLFEELKKHSNLPKIIVGAEVHYFNGINHWEGLKDFVIADTNYVLIEMPMSPWSDRMIHDLETIHTYLGLTPIIAHIDRYIKPFRTHGIPEILASLPVIVQANASFFNQTSTTRLAFKLLKEEKIHLLGSDCHNMDSRPPNLGVTLSKIERKLGSESLHKIHSMGKKVLLEEN